MSCTTSALSARVYFVFDVVVADKLTTHVWSRY